jgi:TolB-like protein
MTTTRRLAAILAADVAGYSRLMAADEVGTLAALKAARREAVDPAIAEHSGRIVKTTGDGMLVEFASAVDAVTCAMSVQDRMASRGGDIAFRIGINVGDIIIDGNDIFGDGVNVAARVEGECEPGRVYLSDDAFRQLRAKTSFTFDDLGEKRLKNLDRLIRMYVVKTSGPMFAHVTVTTLEAGKPLPLPDKPSIAVLPFQNMSGDPEQEYFADGMVEDIITALSRFKQLFVIARNSSFVYKGKAIDIKQVGRELGVRFVLEGSVRKVGNRVRITGQLIDAITGTHLWADRFEGSLENIFDLQDQVASAIVGALDAKLLEVEIARVKRKPVANLAYDCYLRAADYINRWTRSDHEEALQLLYKAIELDPDYAQAYAHATWCLVFLRTMGGARPSEQDRLEARRLAREAIRLGRDDAFSLVWAGFSLATFAQVTSEIEEGATLIDRSLALNPNLARGWNLSGWIRIQLSQHDLAIEHFEHAIRLSPMDTALHAMEWGIATAHIRARRYDKAAEWAERSLRSNPHYNPGAALCLLFSRAYIGDLEKARSAGTRLLQMWPGFRISTWPALEEAPAERRPMMIEALRNAGLPE